MLTDNLVTGIDGWLCSFAEFALIAFISNDHPKLRASILCARSTLLISGFKQKINIRTIDYMSSYLSSVVLVLCMIRLQAKFITEPHGSRKLDNKGTGDLEITRYPIPPAPKRKI